VFERDGFSCKYCGRTADEVTLQVDHVHPVCEGGGNEMENLLTACFDCNSGKSGRVIESMPESEHLRLTQERRELEASLEEKRLIAELKKEQKQDRVNDFCDKVDITSVNPRFLRALESLCNEFGDEQATTWAASAYLRIIGESYASEGRWTDSTKYLYGIARKVREGVASA
tara:strand:+ start:128 stop:643 length:516 start_codon:yes stop_codon:yes gene_type:complete